MKIMASKNEIQRKSIANTEHFNLLYCYNEEDGGEWWEVDRDELARKWTVRIALRTKVWGGNKEKVTSMSIEYGLPMDGDNDPASIDEFISVLRDAQKFYDLIKVPVGLGE